MNLGGGHVRHGCEAADDVDPVVKHHGRRRVEPPSGEEGLLAPRRAIESLDGEHWFTLHVAGAGEGVDRIRSGDNRMRGTGMEHRRSAAPLRGLLEFASCC
jgi:hypothetical protein